jgi:hypothetical protein
VGRLVHLADASVTGIDLEPRQIEVRQIHGGSFQDIELPQLDD